MRHVKLNRWEIIFYFSAWTGAVLYSIYRFYLTCDGRFSFYSDVDYFDTGTYWINRKLDISDDEWVIAVAFLQRLGPWFIFQILISQLLKYFQFSNLTILLAYLTVSLLFIVNFSGAPGVVLLLGQILISNLPIFFNSRRVMFVIQFLLLILLNTSQFQGVIFRWLFEENVLLYNFSVAMFWNMLRSISSNVDIIDSNTSRKDKKSTALLYDFIQSAAYCLYLPTLFLGPFLLYSNFIKGVNEPFKKWTVKRISRHAINLVRYLFWLIFTQLSMYFVYTNAMTYKPEDVKRLDSWAFYGFGYTMGQFFFNKYLVTYGITGEFARIESIDAPPPPKCIGRIHLYSEMWKHFDRGLYQFLIRYIYSPLMKLNVPFKKILASFLTFGFIYIWHGLHLYIFVWSFLNFIGLVLEQVLQSIQNSQTFINWQQKYLSLKNARRLDCFLSVPLLVMSAISNFYFFGGMNIGNLFVFRIFQESISTIVILIIVLYCTCQVSTEMKEIETKRVNKST